MPSAPSHEMPHHKPTRLDVAALFHDLLDQTIRDGLHTMQGPHPQERNYAAALQAASPFLAEARGADLGPQHHDFLQDCLAAAVEVLGDAAREPGARDAQSFLTGFAEGICAMLAQLESGPLPEAPADPEILLRAAEAHAVYVHHMLRGVTDSQAQAHKALAKALSDEVAASRQDIGTLLRPPSIQNVRSVLYAALEHAADGQATRHEPRNSSWLAACHEAHARLRSFVAGATMTLEFAHPFTAREVAWTRPIHDGRLQLEDVQDPAKWWLRPALGLLGRQQAQDYWKSVPRSRMATATALVVEAGRMSGKDAMAWIVEQQPQDLWACRIKAWLGGASSGAQLAHPLPQGASPSEWLADLTAASPSDVPPEVVADVDFEPSDPLDCGHGAFQQAYEEVVRRLAEGHGGDPFLPRSTLRCWVLGFVFGHYYNSLPPHAGHVHSGRNH